jgi:hypothetical protein
MVFLVNFALECAITKVQVNQENLKQNVTHQVLTCADVNLLGENINTYCREKSVVGRLVE